MTTCNQLNSGEATGKSPIVTENGKVIAKDVEYNSDDLNHHSSANSQSPKTPVPQGVEKDRVSSKSHYQKE
jgi:hypothetical protein